MERAFYCICVHVLNGRQLVSLLDCISPVSFPTIRNLDMAGNYYRIMYFTLLGDFLSDCVLQ